MLLVLFLRDPHLMERPQTGEDTSTDPRAKAPLGGVPWGGDAHPRTGIRLHELLVQAIGEAVEEAGGAGDDDVGQQMRANVDVDAIERGLDQLGDGLRRGGRREGGLGVGDGGLCVEERLHDAVAFRAKELVVSVGEFEGPGRGGLCGLFVGYAVQARAKEFVGAWPHLHHALLELGQRALLQQRAVGRVGFFLGRERLELDLGRLAGVDGRFRGNEVVRGDGDGLRVVGLEQGANLRGDVVAAQRGVLDAPFQDHAVVHRGDGYIGSSDIDDERRGLSGRKTDRDKDSMLVDTSDGANKRCDIRCKHTVPRQIKRRRTPFLHGDFDGLLARLGRVPAALGHQQWTVGEWLLVGLHALHLSGHLPLRDIVEAVHEGVSGLRARQSRRERVFPHFLRHVPVLYDAIPAHGVVDGEARAGRDVDIIAVDELFLSFVGIFAVVRRDQRLWRVLSCKTGARCRKPGVEDNGGDLVWTRWKSARIVQGVLATGLAKRRS